MSAIHTAQGYHKNHRSDFSESELLQLPYMAGWYYKGDVQQLSLVCVEFVYNIHAYFHLSYVGMSENYFLPLRSNSNLAVANT